MGDELEWISVAHWSQQTYEQFLALSGEDQSKLVAAYRCELQLRAVLDADRVRRQQAASTRPVTGPRRPKHAG